MRPFDLALFVDENIPPDLISRLRDQGKDVRSVHDEVLVGATDIAILEHARSQNRVLLTHDSDFGQLAIHAGQPYVGIVYLRPGHISADFTWKNHPGDPIHRRECRAAVYRRRGAAGGRRPHSSPIGVGLTLDKRDQETRPRGAQQPAVTREQEWDGLPDWARHSL